MFSGLAVLTSVLTLLAWLSICVASTLGLFKVSGCLQIISGVFMLITVLSYPAGWDNSSVISVCGPEVTNTLVQSAAKISYQPVAIKDNSDAKEEISAILYMDLKVCESAHLI